MRLDQVRDYLTMPEVASRWRATDPDMCRAILKGLLRPSLYMSAQLRRAVVTDVGQIEAREDTEAISGWHYVCGINQVGALDCAAQAVSVIQEAMPGTTLWLLASPMCMSDLLAQSVVMAEDLVSAEAALEAETHWQQRSGQTKEINSVLNTLSAVLADAYRFDPRVRSSIPREITEASERNGHALSQGTVTKWIREAIEQFPPLYMNEPVAKAKG